MPLTKAQIKKDVRTRYIPTEIWDIIWEGRYRPTKGKLTDTELWVMQTPLAQILELPNFVNSHDALLKLWLCILSSHQNDSDEELYNKAKELNLIPDEVIFQGAIIMNRLPILEYLELDSPEIKKAIKEDTFRIVTLAASFGFIECLDKLLFLYPEIKKEFESGDAFINAALNGHVCVLDWFKKHNFAKFKEWFWNFNALSWAARSGHLKVLDWCKLEEGERWSKISQNEYAFSEGAQAFYYAAQNNQTRALDWFKKETGASQFSAWCYAAFVQACEKGSIEAMDWFKKNTPQYLKKMLDAACSVSTMRQIAANGQVNALNWLNEENADKFQETLIYCCEDLFIEASRYGHIDMMERLKELLPDRLQSMIEARGYEAFYWAAGHDDINVLNWLKREAPDKLQSMIAIDVFNFRESPYDLTRKLGYTAFIRAAKNGCLNVLEWIKNQTSSKQLQTMIAHNNYEAFNEAVLQRHLKVIKWFKEQVGELFDSMLERKNYSSIIEISRFSEKSKIPAFFLSRANFFAYVERIKYEKDLNPDEYQLMQRERSYEWIPVCMHVVFHNLLEHKKQALLTNPDVCINVHEEDAKLCFYFIRNYIRQNSPDALDKISFLLSIPAVYQLAHQAVTPGQPNELLNMALAVGNDKAKDILLAIPAVRELSEQSSSNSLELLNEKRLSAGQDFTKMHEDYEPAAKQRDARVKANLWFLYPDYRKQKFNNLLIQLKEIQNELAQKETKNPGKYKKVIHAATTLYNTLQRESNIFFSKYLSPVTFQLFQSQCQKAIEQAEPIFQEQRGVWNQIHPIIRQILGILAALTVIPAVIVEKKSKYGYVQTFFATPETDSAKKLTEFKKKVEHQNAKINEDFEETIKLNL